MIGLAKEAVSKASKDMMIEAGKKAGKYAGRVVVVGAVGIAANYAKHNLKEKGIKLTKEIEKSVKEGAQETADIIQGNKKAQPIKAVKNMVGGAGKAVAAAAVVGAGGIIAARAAKFVMDEGKGIEEDIIADYRKVKYFVETEDLVEVDVDDIEY